MGRVLAAAVAMVLFVLAAILALAGGDLITGFGYAGLAGLTAAVLAHVNDHPKG